MTEQAGMTRAERQELGALVRKREKVMKTEASKRAKQMLAEFEEQVSAIYSFDDDEIWAEATEQAKAAVASAQEIIAARCEDLGIPKEFAPRIDMYWTSRGQNAVNDRRNELRRAAKAKIAALEEEARAEIERISLEAQTQIVASGLESASAQNFLDKMSDVKSLMPSIDPDEVKQIVEEKKKQRGYF